MMLQPPTPKKAKTITQGRDQYSQYREDIRECLKSACEDLDIPAMYRPGVINTPDLSLAIFTLAVFEQLEELKSELRKVKKKETPVVTKPTILDKPEKHTKRQAKASA